MNERLIIKKFIIRKLYRKRMWLHKHTNINNLPKGLSNKLRVSRDVKKAIEELLKGGILISKPTHYGLEVSLNPKKMKEIEDDTQCIVCLSEIIDTLIMPCRHFCLCTECAFSLQESKKV